MNELGYPKASVHGRFQPPHNQHLEYLLEAKKRCEFLWIGITQYDIHELHNSPSNPHRGTAANNPLTYFERITIIRESLVQMGIDENEFSFLPFPLEKPSHLPSFLPLDIPIFTTICDEWNKYKIHLLKNLGYTVLVLFERINKITRGRTIRSQIMEGDKNWENEVPQSSIDAIHNFKIKQRLETFPRNVVPKNYGF